MSEISTGTVTTPLPDGAASSTAPASERRKPRRRSEPDLLVDPFLGHDDDVEAASEWGTHEPPVDPTLLIAGLALSAALGRKGRRLLRADHSAAILVTVPSAAWIDPIISVIHRDAAEAAIFKGRDKPRDRETLIPDIVRSLTRGRLVIGVASRPEQLPSMLRAAADHIVAIAHPDQSLIRKAIRRYTGRSPNTPLTTSELAGLDLPDLAAAMRPRSGPDTIVARLRQAGSQRGVRITEGPTLESLPGVGEARAWALGAVADLARVREGRLDPRELEFALFGGPPGTGKTSLARAMAMSAGVPFIATSVAAWISGSSYLDAVLAQQNAFFDACLANAPCLALIDEAEALPSRASSGEGRNADWWGPIQTNQLLRIDEIRASGKGVILIAATNYPDRIDPALRRPGRFDRTFTITLPDEATLVAILRHHLGAELATEDLTGVARLGLGGTGADAVGWVRAARQRARRENRDLTLSDLRDSVSPPETRPPAFQRAVALHEAAHAVAALRLGFNVDRVSIEPRGTAAGWTQLRPVEMARTRVVIEAEVTELLAGRAADILLGTGPHAGAGADLAMATTRLAAMRMAHGLGDTLSVHCAPAEAGALLARDPRLARSVETHLQSLMRESLEIVWQCRDAILTLAEALLVQRVMTGDEVEAVMMAHPPSRRTSGSETNRFPHAAGNSRAFARHQGRGFPER